MTSSTTIRLDDDLKKELQKELDVAGISMNAYFVMAAKQLVLQKKIPFEVLTEAEIPNNTTRKAMLLADAKDMPSYANPRNHSSSEYHNFLYPLHY